MKAKRCVYLTMATNDGWSIDADLAFPFMEKLGWQIEPVAWRTANYNWDAYTAVYIGTPWDYPAAAQQFLQLLEEIDASSATLVNDLALVRWTLAKTYLRDLASRGADTVPGIWCTDFDAVVIDAAFEQFAVDAIIIKPVVSTNATDTYLLQKGSAGNMSAELRVTFAKREFVVQPFIENVQKEGEYSLFYFAAGFSHAILKVPENGDFRVQEEFGAQILPIQPEAALLAAGRRVLSLVDPEPVYARVDFVRAADGRFLLMELELIEPSMYLRTNTEAPGRFAVAFDDYVCKQRGIES